MAEPKPTNQEQKGTAPRAARIGAGGVLLVDHEIKPPEPPVRTFDTPYSHRDLPGATVMEHEGAPVIVSKPYGSEPRNLDPASGRSTPPTEEQKGEIQDSAARRVARSQLNNEAEERKADEARERAKTGGVPGDKVEAAKRAIQDEDKKLESERTENEKRRNTASEAARKGEPAGAPAGTTESGARVTGVAAGGGKGGKR